MSFGKPVNSRTLANINRANAEFHGTQDAKKDEAVRESAELSEDAVNPEARNSTASGKTHKGQRILGNKQFNMRAAQANKKNVKPSKDISHENGKQVIKQKGQVVSQHDEGDAKRTYKGMGKSNPLTLQRKRERTQPGPGESGHRPKPDYEGPAGKPAPGDPPPHLSPGRDAFPATDKTIADVNAANARFHSADSEDAEYKSNFNSPNERPPYLEEIPAKKKAAPPAKPTKDDEDEAWFQDPDKGRQTGKEAAAGLRGAEIVRTRKGGEEIRNPGKYEGGDYSSKRYAPKASAFHGDAFPATDKTIASINDANKAYYEGSPHAGNAQDYQPRRDPPGGPVSQEEGESKGENATQTITRLRQTALNKPSGKRTEYERELVAAHKRDLTITGKKHEI